jgi:hypothetical protein
MIQPLSLDTNYKVYWRHPTRYKKILFYAKIDGQNWYDLSDYVLKVRISNRIELLESPAIDTATVTVRNVNNMFTPTQYNDTFDPVNGKLNGTPEQGYLNKLWEVRLYILTTRWGDGIELPAGVIEYWRETLLGALNDTVPDGYTAFAEDEHTIVIPLFAGWKPANAITERHKEADIELKDLLWVASQKKPANPLLYVNYTPDQIIQDILVNRLGLDASYLDLQTLTTPWEVFIADNNKTWWQILQEITQATGGKLTCSPDGKIVFRTRIENYTEPATAVTITADDIKNYSIDTKRQYNQIRIESKGYEIGSSAEYVIDHELQGDASVVKAGQTATFELEYNCEYVKDPASNVLLTYYLGDTAVAVDRSFTAGQSAGNIRVDKISAYPDKLTLKITNLATSVDYTIKHVKFSAIPIRLKSELKLTKPNQTSEPDSELSLTSYYSTEAMLSNVADALYSETKKNIKFSLQMNEFYPDVFAGNLVELQLPPKGIASGKFLVYSVEHSLEAQRFQTTLSIVEWSDVVFSISDKEITQATPEDAVLPEYSEVASHLQTLDNSVQDLTAQVQEIDNRTSYIDGSAPATPTGLSLATLTEDGRSYITASWNANTEPDLLGYELAWSYDGANWNYITTADTLVRFEVAGNKTVYVRVRAYDAEGKKSGWTSASIVSAKDEIPPSTPTGLTAVGLFEKVMLRWNENTEEDFDVYELQVATDSNFTENVQTITLKATSFTFAGEVNTTYYFRVRAKDTSGNASNWSSTVSASTVNLNDPNYYDYAAIKTAIIQGSYIDSAWISELDAGKITTGYLDADRIAAGSITIDKLTVTPSFGVPTGTIAYWTNSLVDEIGQITPDGYTEINLAPSIALTPDNAPEGSVVADLLAGNKIFAGKSIQVGNKVFIENTSADKGVIRINSGGTDIVKIGEGVLSDGGDGIRVKNGRIEIVSATSKRLLDSNGIRQMYVIPIIDQIDSSHPLTIPLHLPASTTSSGTTSATARIIAKVEKFRATTSGVTSYSGATVTTTTSGGSHSHAASTYSGGYHKHSGAASVVDGHTHSVSGSTTGPAGAHTHNISIAPAISHTHDVGVSSYNTSHSHSVSIPGHSHSLRYGIYESTATATVTVKLNDNSLGSVSTGNTLDLANISIADGDTITFSSSNLARVVAFIYVEYIMQ